MNLYFLFSIPRRIDIKLFEFKISTPDGSKQMNDIVFIFTISVRYDKQFMQSDT